MIWEIIRETEEFVNSWPDWVIIIVDVIIFAGLFLIYRGFVKWQIKKI